MHSIRFEDVEVASAVLSFFCNSIEQESHYKTEARMYTKTGVRWHRLEARTTIDPITGAKVCISG